MAKNDFVLGTAGHIDHGKSSLIKALCGTDPDRLAEEKRRGITIELGFAQLELASGRKISVVDVPGHEKFVRQMVAGASGMDAALVVIAADDGIMPQTVEHLAVLELLGVKTCIVALTKVDLVDDDWASFMAEEISSALENTPFAGCAIIPCSSTTGEGLPELLDALEDTARKAERTKPNGSMRLPIDRVFSVKGFGTVVTGTLWAGSVAVDDEVEVLPQRLKTRVRSIQVHGADKQSAGAGNRVAMCLNALSCDDVHPGDFLAAPKAITPTDRFDAELVFQDPFKTGKALESGSRAFIAHGTREVIGRILCMNGQASIEPGQSALVQIRLDEPLPVSYQDRFIVRSLTPARVIAGGSVLAAHPRRRSTLTAAEKAMLDALAAGNSAAAIDAYVLGMDYPKTREEICSALGLPAASVKKRLSELVENKQLVSIGPAKTYLAPAAVRTALLSAIESKLMRFHNEHQDAVGLAKEELRKLVDPKLSPELFDALLQDAIAKGSVAQIGAEVCHPKAGAAVQAQVEAAANTLYETLQQAGATPPLADALVAQSGIAESVARKALTLLCNQKKVIRITSELYFTADVLEQHKAAIKAYIAKNGPSTASQLKEACNTSRKYAMPLLEYLDSINFTRRSGDERTLV